MKDYYLAKAMLCRKMAERPTLERSAATLRRMAQRFEQLGAAAPVEASAEEAGALAR